MPEVTECAVMGVPHDKSGEAVAVIIVKKQLSLTVEQVKAWCKQHLTAYKCPRHVFFVDDLPKSSVGKILRRELKPILEQLMQTTNS